MKKNKKITQAKVAIPPVNDGTNTPVPDKNAVQRSSASEAALFKQANNPLGDPHKV
jgi:hypothetical protein